MKRLFCILALLVLCSCACAEGIDLSGMTVEELRALRDQIDQELARKSVPDEGEIIFEDESMRIVFTDTTIQNYPWGSRFTLHIEWTNLSSGPDYIGDRLCADGFADGIDVRPEVQGRNKSIQPGVTIAQEVTCLLYDDPQDLEIRLYNGNTGATYRTLYFQLR